MKNNLPNSWAVKNDGSELFKTEVINYINDNFKEVYYYKDLPGYYGVNENKPFYSETLSGTRYATIIELTISEFIELKAPKIPENLYIVASNSNRDMIKEYFTEYALFSTGAKFGVINGQKMYHRADTEYKDYNNWIQITTEDFKKHIFNKKIKGYKLKKTEYKAEAAMIAAGNIASFISEKSIIEPGSHYAKNLEKAGVLDLWFEKIFEDSCTILNLGSKGISVKVYKDKFEADGDTFPIVELKMLKKHLQDFQNNNSLISPSSKHERPIKIVSFTVSCTTFEMDDIDKVLNAAEKLN